MTDHAGQFGWHDLNSHHESASEAFYTTLFGWTVTAERAANGYRRLSDGDTEFGGILPLTPDMKVPTTWIGYLLVDDLDDITSRAKSLGGWYPFEEMPIPGVGRFSVIFDPTGAPVMALEPNPEIDFSAVGSGGHGSTVVWNELLTTDIASSATFHRDLYGWEFDAGPLTAGRYVVARTGGKPVAGLFQPEPGPANSAWMIYFSTTDARRGAADAAEVGAVVVHQPTEVPGIGVTAWLNDPLGATFGLMQPADGWFERLSKPAAKGE